MKFGVIDPTSAFRKQGSKLHHFSLLGLAFIPEGGAAADALSNTIDLARQAEGRGYRRYWLRASQYAGYRQRRDGDCRWGGRICHKKPSVLAKFERGIHEFRSKNYFLIWRVRARIKLFAD